MEIRDINSISFPASATPQLKLRGYYNNCTRPAEYGSELRWQEALAELDPELHLRWSYLHSQWSIYYDHCGKLSVIRTFKPGESFWLIYRWIKQNGATNNRQLRKIYEQQKEDEAKKTNDLIDDAARECAISVHNSAVRKVTTDGVRNEKY